MTKKILFENFPSHLPYSATHQSLHEQKTYSFNTPPSSSLEGIAAEQAAASYFRCHPLHATISLAHCRSNRNRPDAVDSFTGDDDHVIICKPPVCNQCKLALAVEKGHARFYTAEQVYQRKVQSSIW